MGALDRMWCNRSHSYMRSILCCAFGRSFVSAPCTFDHGHCVRPHCVRSHKMRSIADNCLKIPTAQELKRWSMGRLGRCGKRRSMWLRSIMTLALELSALDLTHCARSHCQGSKLQLSLISPILNPNLHQGPTTH